MAAQKDIFSRTTQYGGSISGESTTMTFANEKNKNQLPTGLLLQRVDIRYSQTISRLFALESGKAYFVAGPTSGSLTIAHVVGPAGLMDALWLQYGNVCNISGAFQIGVEGGCGEKQKRGTIKVNQPVINSINLSVAAQDIAINSGFSAQFVSLEVLSSGGDAA